LDPQQVRLQTELFLEGRQYAIKRGDAGQDTTKGCTIVDASIALACASKDVKMAVQAKREAGKLFDDITKPPYTALFPPTLTAQRLWRAVELSRMIEASLAYHQPAKGRERMVAVHGNRFVQYRAFRLLEADRLDDPMLDYEAAQRQVSAITVQFLRDTIAAVASEFPEAQLASLFKNASKCEELNRNIEAQRQGSQPGTLFDV